MNYSVQNLNQVADCNVLLAWAAKEQAALNFKKLSDEFSGSKFAQTSQEIEADLQAVIVELAGVEAALTTLPEGESRRDFLNRQKRLDYRKFVLETRKSSYGTVALLEKEMDLARVKQEIDEVDAFMEVVTERKTILESQA